MIKFPGSPLRTAHSVSLTDGRRGSSCRQVSFAKQGQWGWSGGLPGEHKGPCP